MISGGAPTTVTSSRSAWIVTASISSSTRTLLGVGVLPDRVELEGGIAQNGGGPLEGLDESVRLPLNPQFADVQGGDRTRVFQGFEAALCDR
jgi:hypothetical protein